MICVNKPCERHREKIQAAVERISGVRGRKSSEKIEMSGGNSMDQSKKEMNLFQLAWPIFVSNILGILLGFIDVYVLSKVNDLAASAISAACQITSICSLVFSVVCGATTILVAQYLGRKDRGKASKVTALCIVLNVSFGVIVSGIVLLFHDPFLRILGAEAALFDMASSYIGIVAWGIVLDAYQSALGSVMYSHGETRISMYISSGMGILNLILDMVMVLGLWGFPRLEVRGAAVATLITKLICAGIMSLVFFTRIESVSIFRTLAKAGFGDVKAIFKLGVPSIFDSLNYSITQLVITGIIFHNLTETDIIARTYLLNIATFFQLFTNAISSATQLMIGHEIGAGDYEKADRDCMHGLRISVLMTGAVSLGALLFSNALFGIFTENPVVIRIGFYLMAANVFVEVGRAVNVVFVGSLRGAGDVSIPVLIAAICMWVIAVGGSWMIVNTTSLGIVGVWVIAGVDECIRGVIMYGRWKSGKWRGKCVAG